MKRKIVLSLTLFLIVAVLFGRGLALIEYSIKNESNVIIMITTIPNVSIQQGRTSYYKNDIEFRGISIGGYAKYTKRVIPCKSYTSILALNPILEQTEYFDGEMKITEYNILNKDIVQYFFEGLFIYDSNGNIIMTREDIDGNSFTDGNHPTLYITQEMVEAGRRKYAGRGTE
jgi:hypothetical protein